MGIWVVMSVVGCDRRSLGAVGGTGGIGGTPPPTNTVRYWPYHLDAHADVQGYARALRAMQYGTNINDNGVADRLSAYLSACYLALGTTSVVDAAWFDQGETVYAGQQSLTLRGQTGWHTNALWTTNGLRFDGQLTTSLEYWGLTNVAPYCTFICTYAAETNYNAPARHLWTLSHNSGITTGIRLQLWFQSVSLNVYTADGATYTLASAYFSKAEVGTSGGQGARFNDEQYRTVICQSDGTNIVGHVDGLPSMFDNAGNQNTAAACNRMTFARRADGSTNVFLGRLRSWMWINRLINSNELYQVDQAHRILFPTVNCVVLGDSISELNTTVPSREWSAEMWHALGQPENVRIFNYAYSGKTAVDRATDATNVLVLRRPLSRFDTSHLFLLAGKNDFLGGATVATTVGTVSNICRYARSLGYKVHLLTDLPIGTLAAGYTAGKAQNVLDANAYYRAAMLTTSPMADYLWDTATLITNPEDTQQLSDGVHPTLSYKQLMGQLIAAGRSQWLW